MDSALQRATSVHIRGTLPSSTIGTMSLNLSLTRSGEYFGKVSVKNAAFTALRAGKKVYVKMNASFLKHAKIPATACSMMCGKCLLFPAKSLSSSFAWSQIFQPWSQRGANARVSYDGESSVGGQPVWEVRSPSAGIDDIAQRSAHYPLLITPPANQSGVMTLTQWNNATIPPPPPPDQVVTMSQLAGQ